MKKQLVVSQSKFEREKSLEIHDLFLRNEAIPLKCPNGEGHFWVVRYSNPYNENVPVIFHECSKCGFWGKHVSVIETTEETKKRRRISFKDPKSLERFFSKKMA